MLVVFVLAIRRPLWGSFMVHTYNVSISDESTKSRKIHVKHSLRDVVRLVSIFDCLAYDWKVKNE